MAYTTKIFHKKSTNATQNMLYMTWMVIVNGRDIKKISCTNFGKLFELPG